MSSHRSFCSYLWLFAIFTLFHCCFSVENTNNIQCTKHEKNVLLEFKNDLVDGANRLVSWNSSNEDCCKWYGVTCDKQTGHVTKISLRGPDVVRANMESQEASIQRFGGKISRSLRNLTSLEYLDLSCNDFGGNPIPTYLGSIKSLTYLNLSDSRFSGEIPAQLGNLSALQVLSVRNRYSGQQYVQWVTSLQWLSGLSLLRHLEMSGVQLGQMFDWAHVMQNLLPSSLVELHFSHCGLPPITSSLTVVNLSSLSILDLSYNSFSSSSIPGWIASLHNLVSLNLAFCDFNGPVPAGLMNIVSLSTLDLRSNQLTGIQTMRNSSTLNNICSLKEINLSWNRFDGKSLLDVLPNLFECESSKLESLNLATSGLSGNLPPQLGNLKNLVYINLYNNSISGIIPDSLGNLSSLQTLYLRANLLSGPIPDSITWLSSLKNMNLRSNSIAGPLPYSLGELSDLQELDLSDNEISGTLPQTVGRLTNLTILNIRNNLLTGVVTEDHFGNLTNLITLRADANMLRFEPSSTKWEPPFQLQILILSSWSLGPKFPSWLQNQTNLSYLYLASSGISDNVPSWFWTTFSALQYLDLSDNNLFKVSMNNFLCPKTDAEPKQIVYMNLGNTNLSGVLPDCWTSWKFLKMLNLQNNYLTGAIPKSLANLSLLESLNMRNNKLSGELPMNLMNSKSLVIIDLAENELTGSIPISTGREATVLKILNLRSNKLIGKIPDVICRLDSIQILDLSDNNLSGKIPNCFNNFSVMTGKVNPSQDVKLDGQDFKGSALLIMKGRMNGYNSILGLVTLLDLSGNDLSGSIPTEITQLVVLLYMNFSSNMLTGRIPDKIGDMKRLESLDLSKNRLEGNIPSSMSRLSFLNWLNLSYNSLAGRIPSSTQLQYLDETSFLGNELCGVPVQVRCEREGGKAGGDAGRAREDGSGSPDWRLITSIVVGFVVGILVVVGPLIASKLWRIAYYRFWGKLGYMVYDVMHKYC